MATAPSANDLTRQQLDELDALLQRMLTLPVNPPDAATPSSGVSSWRTDSPNPTFATATRLAAPPLPADLPPTYVSATPAPEPTVPVLERKVAPSHIPVRTTPFPSASRPMPAIPDIASPTPPSEPVSVVLWPLVALNWVVDSILGLCGPPGWLLRSRFGKNLLGLAGIGLLAYTAAHLAIEQGWMTLPFPLPWPR